MRAVVVHFDTAMQDNFLVLLEAHACKRDAFRCNIIVDGRNLGAHETSDVIQCNVHGFVTDREGIGRSLEGVSGVSLFLRRCLLLLPEKANKCELM